MKTKFPPSITHLFSHWINRWQPSEGVILVGSGLAVGLMAGAGVWLFKQLIDLAHLAFFGWMGSLLARLGTWTIILIPTLGGVVVGLVVHHFIGQERHHGVAGVMEAAALAGGRLRYQRIPAKTVAQPYR